MLPAEAGDTSRRSDGADNATVRTVFVDRPRQEDQAHAELPYGHRPQLRRSLARTRFHAAHRKHKVSTPVNWKPGEDVIIVPAVSDEEAQQKYPGFKTLKPYLRVVAQPK